MRLCVNIGNSDLRVIAKDTERDLVFRDKEYYSEKINDLAQMIEDLGDSFQIDDTGKLLCEMNLFDKVDGVAHPIDSIRFQILDEEIQQIEQSVGEDITEIIVFVTRQKGEQSIQDTEGLFRLLAGRYGQIVYPSIGFKEYVLTCDPSDYGEVYARYAEFFADNSFSHTAIAIAQGTPAMGFALSSCSSKYSKDVKQFYAAHLTDKVVLKPLQLFSKQEIERIMSHTAVLLRKGEYIAVRELVANGMLATIPGFETLLDYLIVRSNYRFSEAKVLFDKLEIDNPSLWKIMEPSGKGLSTMTSESTLDGKNKEQLQYCSDTFPYMLFETLQNIRFNYKNENYFLAIALMTSFLDIIYTTVIARTLGFKTMEYSSKTNSFIELDEYVGKYIIHDPHLKNGYRDISNKWKVAMSSEGQLDPSKGYLVTNGPVMAALVKWLANQPNALEFILNFYKFQKNMNQFDELRRLRNRLPIAHSVQGIQRELIEKTLNNVMTFDQVLDSFEKIIWDMNPKLEKSCSYRDCNDQIVEEISFQLNRRL
ncbi:MAG: hypothetical protein WBI82_13135 [Sphaerochaeta sp.]